MSSLVAQRPMAVVEAPASVPAPRWSLIHRITFRFFFSYFLLFLSTNSILSGFIPFGGLVPLWRPVVIWAGTRVLHTRYDITTPELAGGVSNTAFGLILCLCYLVTAAIATALWSVLDRRRAQYERLHAWLRLLLRFGLAATMINYGVVKVIPVQMTSPLPLGYLTERVGDLTPMRMLWMSVGTSTAYEIFTGSAELLGGVLLLLPRTTLLGALLCLADMVMVFTLNMAYDVQVKLFSFHLLVMAALLVAPDLPRLINLFLFNRRVEPAEMPPLSRRKGLDRGLQAFVLLFGLYAIFVNARAAHERYGKFHPPRPPLYGVWNVEAFNVGGREVPLFTDPDRWRTLTFQTPGRAAIELMIGSRRYCALELDLKGKTMRLRGRQTAGEAAFSFQEPEPGVLLLNGLVDGRPARLRLRKMALIGESFHWVFVPDPEDLKAEAAEKRQKR